MKPPKSVTGELHPTANELSLRFAISGLDFRDAQTSTDWQFQIKCWQFDLLRSPPHRPCETRRL